MKESIIAAHIRNHVRQSGKSLTQVAREMQVNRSFLYKLIMDECKLTAASAAILDNYFQTELYGQLFIEQERDDYYRKKEGVDDSSSRKS